MMPVKKLVLRTAAGLVGTLLAFSFATTASAGGPGPDLAAAAAAAHSTEATKLLGKAAQRPGSAAAKSTAKLAIQQDVIPVYALSADFVRTGAGDVGTLWYIATPATKGTDKLTVFTAPDQAGAWHPVNVATGNTEATMAAAARGAKLLIEPQLGAWYAVNGTTLRALNPEATKAIGSAPIALSAYRQQVSNRYQDKQAGSTYAKNGTAGGYDVAAQQTQKDTPGAWLILAAGTAVALALGAVTLITRRRRTA
ncbi:hypothetical protein [Kribbella sp. NPDC051620]|uniref:hypothetical protein n=1 Tax=Kribbella sp. NPDC051620 TaxID=3364120 RepID=UPI0037916541